MNDDDRVVLEPAPAPAAQPATPPEPHVHHPGCGHVHDAGPSRSPHSNPGFRGPTRRDIDRDAKNLNLSGYGAIKDKFDKSFVIMNTRTGMVVELKAASSLHACNMVGWRQRYTRVLEVKDTKKEDPNGGQPATIAATAAAPAADAAATA